MKNSTITRRKFLGTAAGAAAFTMVPLNYAYTGRTQTKKPNSKKPNSKVNGVQLGLTTYSYLDIPHSLEQTLQYLLQDGVNTVEMRYVLEEGLGIPQGPDYSHPAFTPQGQALLAINKLPEKEKAEHAKVVAAQIEEQRKWRLSCPMQKYKDIRKMYNDAGVDIHLAKFCPSSWSDEEIDYAFNAANALGAYGVGDEMSVAGPARVYPFAEKHHSLIVFHTHGQLAQTATADNPAIDIDKFLSYSPVNRLTFDVGHHYRYTGQHPNIILEKYHDRICSIHLRDATGPKSDPPSKIMPFGQGEVPLADVLLLIKKEKWPINCDIEYNPKPENYSDAGAVKEIARGIDYCRNILE
jgi:hypothetical protein